MMNNQYIIEFLTKYNEWRRFDGEPDDESPKMPEPAETIHLRHTWASWHVQNGTPIHVLQELGGWADLSMVLRYAHLSGEHLREYVNNANAETNLLHPDFEQKKRL